MSYVGNVSKFLTFLVENPPDSGVNIYNYSDKPDFDMENLINIVQSRDGKSHKTVFRLPFAVGLFGGYVFDFLSLITRRSFPVSSIRIKKFCANTVIRAANWKKPVSTRLIRCPKEFVRRFHMIQRDAVMGFGVRMAVLKIRGR